jgi:hypothetical protein
VVFIGSRKKGYSLWKQLERSAGKGKEFKTIVRELKL